MSVALVLGACAGARPPSPSSAAERECLAAPPPAAPVESATVVVTSTVDPNNAPRATTWGERFVFDLAYDTPLRIDCGGRPLGPALYRLGAVARSTLPLEPVDASTGPRLTIRSATEADARDLVDAGVDLLLTESPAVATYAATRADVVSIPLAWDRTWVVVTARPTTLMSDTSIAFRSGLARDAVRADARAAQGPYWWSDTTGCATRTTPSISGGNSRIVYPRDEPIARALAERLVALAGGGITAAGLAPNAFNSALTAGTERAYVIPLPRMSRDRCLAIDAVITPLIDTRLHAVVRRNRLNLTFTWDSTVTISPARP